MREGCGSKAARGRSPGEFGKGEMVLVPRRGGGMAYSVFRHSLA